MSGDPRAELFELVRAARAWVSWVRESGADDVTAESSPTELLQALSGAPQPRARRGAPSRTAPAAPRRVAATAGPAAAEGPAAAARTEARPDETLSSEDRRKRLATIAEEVRGCTRCRLHETRTQTVFARGNPDAELVFVGEGPGAEEDRQGLPFVGAAGQLLDKMIAAMGYHPNDVYITNIVKCRPPNNRKPEPDEIEACTPYLREQLDLMRPKAMVALGATGVSGLLGGQTGITRLRGTWKLYRGRVPLMPTFHPAYLLRSPEKKRDVWSDLKQVMQRLGKQPPKKSRP